MADPTFDPNKPFEVQDAGAAPVAPATPAPTGRVAKPFKDEDFPEYQRMVLNRRTTPDQLSGWLEERGYGRSNNAAEVLSWHRKPANRRIAPVNQYVQDAVANQAPAPDGNPQPGTPTDWLPDFVQDDVERIGLSLGFIDPKTYYGRGNYGENARAPNRQTTIGNPALPSWGERFSRSVSETFSEEGGGVNAYLLRAGDDMRADDSIRRYGSEHNWTGAQIDAAIAREKEDRGKAIEEVRQQRAIRDNDEVRRAEGLGTDPETERAIRARAAKEGWSAADLAVELGRAPQRSTWSGWAGRGSADLAGAVVGDANPSYVFAPEIKGVSALAERAAPVLGRIAERLLPSASGRAAAPVVERVAEAAAPTVGRMAGQGSVQAGINTGTQADEVSRGLRENIDPVEVGIHGLLGAGFQGGAEGLGKLAPQVARWITGRGGKVEGNIGNPEGLGSLESDLALLADRDIAPDTIGSVDEIRIAAAKIRNPDQPVAEPEGGAIAPEQPRPIAPEEIVPDAPTVIPDEAVGPVDPVAPDPAAPLPEGASTPDAAASSEAPQFEGDVVTRFTAALNDAGKLSKEQSALLSQSRSEKLKAVVEARRGSGGEGGLRAELAQLKGETPKVDYEGVRGQFTQKEVDGLFDVVKNNQGLSLFESINARTGLAKLLDGTVPSKSEINLLSKVFPPDFIKAALKHRSTSSKITDFAGNALNLPRSLMSTLDLSAPLRQGVFLVGRKEFYKSFASMFKQFGSERAFRGVIDDIKGRDTYPLMEESNLSLSDMGHDLAAREEAFMSQWAERIPGVGRVVRASERGFSGFLNKLRADTFDDLVRRSVAAGVDFKSNPKALSDIASFINSATGRGNLGKLNSAAPMLNGLFFSPRLIASRITMLNPVYYAQLSPVVRQEAVKSLLSFGAIATTVLGLAKAGGAEVEDDPRSSDFGKIKVGNTRYDILGGFGQYITLGSRLATNETKTIKGGVQTLGEKYGSRTRLDVAANFLGNKASPVAGYVRDYLKGEDPVGNEFDARKDAAQLFIPLFLQDVAKVYEDGGLEAVPKVLPGFFGVGVGTYGDKPTFDNKKGYTEEVAPVEDVPAPVEPVTEEAAVEFDPNAPFGTTTESNLTARDTIEGMGLTVTDEGIRSEAEQADLYNNTQGAAAPGTSPHEVGNAIDIRVPKGVKPSDIVAELKAKGYKGVTIITRRHGTGPHWHIQWDSVE